MRFMVAVLYGISAVMAAAWCGAVAWALCADRSRGRRRCPRCWYRLEGASRLCPECGREAQSEGALFRTRRRWGLAAVLTVVLLVPAAGLAGFAWVRQAGGWSAMPASVITRLLWLRAASIDDEAVSRVEADRLTPAQAERVVVEAARRLGSERAEVRATGFRFLQSLPRNTFDMRANVRLDHPVAISAIRPELSASALLQIVMEGDLLEAAQAMDLLVHLRGVDERADLGAWAERTLDNERIRAAALEAVRRTHGTVEMVQDLRGPIVEARRLIQRRGDEGARTVKTVAAYAKVVAALENDLAALGDWARRAARGEAACPEDGSEGVWRVLALWLWCRLDGFSPESLDDVKTALADPEDSVRSSAASLLAGYAWSDWVEEALRAALKDQQDHVKMAAISSAARFGSRAAPLIPDLLVYAGSAARRSASGGFVHQYLEIGGDPRELLRVVSNLLDFDPALTNPEQRWQQGQPPPPPPRMIRVELWWLMELGLRDEEAAQVVKRHMEGDPALESRLDACVAYAVLSGDVETATRTVLEARPDFRQPLIMGTPQEAILRLIQRGVFDASAISQACIADRDQRAAFLNVLDSYVSTAKLAAFEGAIRACLDDEDPAVSSMARALIDKIEAGR